MHKASNEKNASHGRPTCDSSTTMAAAAVPAAWAASQRAALAAAAAADPAGPEAAAAPLRRGRPTRAGEASILRGWEGEGEAGRPEEGGANRGDLKQ